MNSDDLKKLITEKTASHPALRSLMKRIQSGRATFKDTAEYSRICSEILGKCLSENVLSLTDREAIAADMLRDSYSETNAVLGQVQRSIDKKNGLNIRPQTAVFPLERVQQFAHSLIDPTVPDETIQRRAGSGAANISMSFHDDYMEENAKFRSKAGLLCYIDRETDGNCCKWCTAMAGRYVYGEEPHDVYRRHDNCGCTVVYENGRQRQNVWTKRQSNPAYDREYLRERDRIKAEERNRRRKMGRDYKGPIRLTASQSRSLQSHMNVFTNEQARALEQRNLAQIRGLNFNSSSIDNGGGSGIISSRGSGAGQADSSIHTFQKIGEMDFSDKKAIAASLLEFEQKYEKSMIEHCRVFCTNGEVYEVHGDLDTVNTTLLGDKMKGSINEHNHVKGRSQYSFSWEDIDSSAKDGTYITMAYDEKYRYTMIFPKSAIDAEILRDAYDISENEVALNNYNHQYFAIGSRISDEDYQHEVIKRTCERIGVKYERKPKT